MKCKIAYLDKNAQAHKSQHRVAGPNTKFFHNPNAIPGQLAKFKPDLVFVNKGDQFDDLNFIKHITGTYKTAYWFGDWRTQFPQFMYDWAQHAHIVFFNVHDPQLFSQIKGHVFTIHQGADPTVFKPLNGIPKIHDVGFGGHFYGKKTFPNGRLRLDVIHHLKEQGLNVAVVGDGWSSDIKPQPKMVPELLNKFYNQCRTTIGISHFTDVKYSTSNRLYQCMAVGVPHLAWDCPGIKELFATGYIGVKNLDELTGKIKILIENPDLANTIGNMQREQILKYHTFEHAWQRIENKIKQVFPELR
jgi:hypothetical protein